MFCKQKSPWRSISLSILLVKTIKAKHFFHHLFLIFLTNSKNVYLFINNKCTCPFDRQKIGLLASSLGLLASLKMPANQNIISIWQSDAPDSMKLSKQKIFSIIFFLIFLTNLKNVYSFINNKSTCPFDRQQNWTEPFFLS